MWELVEANRDPLARTALKTILKNVINRVRVENRIDANPAEEFVGFQKAVADFEIDAGSVATRLDELVREREWRWIPGKEVLGYLVGAVPDFWKRVGQVDAEDLRALLIGNQNLAELVEATIANS
jgi:hypothetical protein